MRQNKPVASSSPLPVDARWSSATAKSPWFDDESVAATAAVDDTVKNAIKPVAAEVVAVVVGSDVPSWSTSESSH